MRRGLLVVDLEDEDEDEGEEVMKSVEGKEEMMPAIPEEGGELDEDSKDGAQASGSPREEGEKAMKKAIENSLQDKSGR